MKLNHSKMFCIFVAFILILASAPFVSGLSAAEMKASNDNRYLYISYEGDWVSQINFSADVYVNDVKNSMPLDVFRLNVDANAPKGEFFALNPLNDEIESSKGTFFSSGAQALWGYESLVFEVQIPLAAFGYAGEETPLITLYCTTLGDIQLHVEQIESAQDPEDELQEEILLIEDEPVQDLSENDNEEDEEEFDEEDDNETIDTPTVSGGFVIDGYYTEWDKIDHTEISWSDDEAHIHEAALVIQDERLYVHLVGTDGWKKQLPTDKMYLYINGNIAYDKKGRPLENNVMLILIAEVNNDMTMGDKLKKIKSPKIVSGLGAFEYKGSPKRYLGQAAFTVYDAQHNQGDECEFYIDLSEISAFFGVNENEIGEIAMHFPNLGAQVITVTGVSTGPYLGIALSAAIAGGYWLIIKRKKGKVE